MKELQKFFEWNNLYNFIKLNIFKIVIAFIIFKISGVLKKYISNILEKILIKSKIDKSISSFLMSFFSILYYVILVLIIAGLFNINLSSIMAFLSAAGLILGFAFKETLGNFCGGLIILTFKPFKVGHTIEFKQYIGDVKSIELFYTKIKTPQNELVIIPNGMITNNELRNMTNEKVRRLDLVISVSYDADIKLVKETLNKIVENEIFHKEKVDISLDISKDENKNEKYILPMPAPVIGVGELGASAVLFNVFVYTKSENYFKLKLKLNEKIKLIFDEKGIKIPYNQMDIHIS